MLKEIKNCNNNELLNNFSCFNKVLYDNFDYNEETEEAINYNKENNISDDESSINTSCQSIELNDKDENKFIPFNLLEQEIIDDKKENDNSNFIHKLNLNCHPFIPKSKLSQNLGSNNAKNKNDNAKNLGNNNNLSYNYICPFLIYTNNNINKNNKNKIKKEKKKKNFIQKEGDWVCYDCKNINFPFRNKCNRCKLLKEESETKFLEAEKRILKLYNINEIKIR